MLLCQLPLEVCAVGLQSQAVLSVAEQSCNGLAGEDWWPQGRLQACWREPSITCTAKCKLREKLQWKPSDLRLAARWCRVRL